MFKFNLGFGGVTAPADYGPPPQDTPREPLPELPEMKEADVQTLRLENTLARRLPQMPSGSLEGLEFSNSRQIEAAELMDDMRVSYAVSRGYDRRGKARAKAQARQNDRQIKNSGSSGKRQRRKLSGRSQRMNKSTVLRNARDVLGMGTDLYR